MADEQGMDVIGSLFKISRELSVVSRDLRLPQDLSGMIDGAAFMIDWIAKGLDREFQLSAERYQQMQQKGLNP